MEDWTFGIPHDGLLRLFAVSFFSGASVAFVMVRCIVRRYFNKIEETEEQVQKLQRDYVSRTEFEAYLGRMEARLESQATSGFNAVHRRLDELYQVLLNSRR
ncbi:MAG: hypothetical protein WC096_08045 [Sphaerochaetaceae bacterium]